MNWSSSRLRYALNGLMALAMLYGVLAGLRTVTDADTGWQLASGRYIAQNHRIPSTDVLSYTARDQKWIYPPLAELLLYGVYIPGGFAALSWLNSAACAATLAIAFSAEGSLAAIALAILAAKNCLSYGTSCGPVYDTIVRRLASPALASLPRAPGASVGHSPLLVVWVNAHPGFVAGLTLLAGYVALELTEAAFPNRRRAAVARLRVAAPWLLAALPATLCNPWGWNIYTTVMRQEQAQGVHENLIAEWRHTPISLETLSQALNWRNPESSYWWLLAAAAIAAVVALKRKQPGAAALLIASGYLSLRNLRFQALFAVVAIMVAAPYLSGWFEASSSEPVLAKPRAKRKAAQAPATPWVTISCSHSARF